MRLGVPRASTAAALTVVATAAAVTVLVPGVRDRVVAGVGALSAPDAHDAIEAFRAYVLGYGAWAPAVSAALMVLQAIVAPLPAFVVTFANGLLFGWVWGGLLSWTSAMAGAALCFWIARALGRPMVERLLGGAAALDSADAFFARHGARAVVVARLLPFVPFDPISFGAGITSTRFVPFLVATGVGQIPATILYSYLGERLTGSVRGLFWLSSTVVALAIVGWACRGALGSLRGGERRRAACAGGGTLQRAAGSPPGDAGAR